LYGSGLQEERFERGLRWFLARRALPGGAHPFPHGRGRGPTVGLIKGQCAVDDFNDTGRRRGCNLRERPSGLCRRGDQYLVAVFSIVHWAACEEREDRRANRPQVRLRIDVTRLAECLLGRHEGGRAEQHSRPSASLLSRKARGGDVPSTRDPEVENLEAALLGDK
jgi:hypothetical protein